MAVHSQTSYFVSYRTGQEECDVFPVEWDHQLPAFVNQCHTLEINQFQNHILLQYLFQIVPFFTHSGQKRIQGAYNMLR